MNTRQLAIMIAAVTVLSLTLAWVIERAQIRNFMSAFEQWWRDTNNAA